MSKPDLISAFADRIDTAEATRVAEAVERARLRLELAQRVTAVGMTLLSDLERRVAAARAAPVTAQPNDDAPDPIDAAGDFAKISRALRLTLDLEARFDEGLRALQAGEDVALKEHSESRARRDAEAEKARHQARRNKVETQVAIAIARESESEEGDEERHDALYERLMEDNAYDDLTDRPLREVVGQLCADIGLTFDGQGWRGEDGWPEPPRSGPGARDRWSPFRTASPRPLMPAPSDQAAAGYG